MIAQILRSIQWLRRRRDKAVQIDGVGFWAIGKKILALGVDTLT